MPSYADWVSTGALALSAFLAVREIQRSRSDEPSLSVTTTITTQAMTGEMTASIRVANLGSRPVTVGGVAWEVLFPEMNDEWRAPKSRPSLRRTPRTLGLSDVMDGARLTIRVPNDDAVLDPPLPFRLEGNDEVVWHWPAATVERLRTAGRFRAAVQVSGLRPRRLLHRHATGGRIFYSSDGRWQTFEMHAHIERAFNREIDENEP